MCVFFFGMVVFLISILVEYFLWGYIAQILFSLFKSAPFFWIITCNAKR